MGAKLAQSILFAKRARARACLLGVWDDLRCSPVEGVVLIGTLCGPVLELLPGVMVGRFTAEELLGFLFGVAIGRLIFDEELLSFEGVIEAVRLKFLE